MQAYGCVGDWVFSFLFILVCPTPYQPHAAQRDSHWSLHTMIRSLRSRLASFEDFCGVHFRNGRILRLGDERADGDVRRLVWSAIRVPRGSNVAAISAGGSFECSPDESEESCL